MVEILPGNYVAHHGKNFLMANDPWFRPVSIHSGPDGGVFVSDWNDLGECHDSDGAYRSSGRIYKITYGQPKPAGDLNLARLSDAELVKLQLHRNDWQVFGVKHTPSQEGWILLSIGQETADDSVSAIGMVMPAE